ncbi:MAG TPA: hypothetical protein VMY88_00070 [Acidimicrobiales bacterium]|nr:hypothetical protein [Acidimicrobiales bacterium]
MSLTPLEAVERAAYALSASVTLDFARDPEAPDVLVCTLHPRVGDPDEELLHRFRQEVTDQVLRVRIGEQTAPVRDLIYAVAFSRTGLIAEVVPE